MSNRSSNHVALHMLVNLWCLLALNWVHDPIWLVFIAVVLASNLGIMMRSYIKGPELTTEQKLELSRQKTAELEADLGYEPLNLHELDEILLDDWKNRKEQP